jgi:hypothetical protein
MHGIGRRLLDRRYGDRSTLVCRETWIDLFGDNAKTLEQMFTKHHRDRDVARVRSGSGQCGDGTPVQVHQNENEHIIILEGKAHIVNGEEFFDADAGTAITLRKAKARALRRGEW